MDGTVSMVEGVGLTSEARVLAPSLPLLSVNGSLGSSRSLVAAVAPAQFVPNVVLSAGRTGGGGADGDDAYPCAKGSQYSLSQKEPASSPHSPEGTAQAAAAAAAAVADVVAVGVGS